MLAYMFKHGNREQLLQERDRLNGMYEDSVRQQSASSGFDRLMNKLDREHADACANVRALEEEVCRHETLKQQRQQEQAKALAARKQEEEKEAAMLAAAQREHGEALASKQDAEALYAHVLAQHKNMWMKETQLRAEMRVRVAREVEGKYGGIAAELQKQEELLSSQLCALAHLRDTHVPAEAEKQQGQYGGKAREEGGRDDATLTCLQARPCGAECDANVSAVASVAGIAGLGDVQGQRGEREQRAGNLVQVYRGKGRLVQVYRDPASVELLLDDLLLDGHSGDIAGIVRVEGLGFRVEGGGGRKGSLARGLIVREKQKARRRRTRERLEQACKAPR